jgi:hypothetical protein
MIQFYDDRPGDPIAAFIYFETVFRADLLKSSSNGPYEHDYQNPHAYAYRLLIAKRELELSILPEWEFRRGYSVTEFRKEMYLRFHREFDDEMFVRFQQDVRSILPTLNELCSGEALYDPHSAYCWYQPALRALMEADPKHLNWVRCIPPGTANKPVDVGINSLPVRQGLPKNFTTKILRHCCK